MKVAIVGMGSMGKKHFESVKKNKKHTIVGVVDPLFKNKFYNNVVTYTNVNDLLNITKPDCAIISTPTTLHLSSAIPFIKNHVSLLIEKPITATVEESKELQFLAKKHNSKIAIGYIERFNPVINELKKHIKNKNILKISAKRHSPLPNRINDVGVNLDLSVHDIDLICYLMNKNIKEYYAHNNLKNTAIFNIVFEDNSMGLISSSWEYPIKQRTIDVLTGDCLYHADLLNLTLTCQYHDRNDVIKVSRINSLDEQFEDFCNYVQERNSEIAEINDGIRSLKIAIGKKNV